MSVRISRFARVCASVVAAQATLGLYIARYGPTHPIPMHFNGAGVVDRWGSRADAAVMVLLLAGVSAVLVALVGVLSRRAVTARRDAPAAAHGAQAVILIATSGVCLMNAVLVFGGGGAKAATGVGMIMLCLIMAAIGAWLGKVGPNPLVGVRTPWTFASRLAWDKANRLAGRLFFWGGLLGAAAAPFAPEPLGFRSVVAGVLLIAVACVFESWRVWRTDPDRTSAM